MRLYFLLGKPSATAAAILSGALFAGPGAEAAYVATGRFEGTVCSGFIVKSCGAHPIDAVKSSDGKLFEVRRVFESVDSFSESGMRCTIRTKSSGLGLISMGVDALKGQTFMTRQPDGSYKELDVDYITFPCKRR